MLGHMGHVLVGVADSAMVGNVNSASLAAASLANGLFTVLLTFGIGISYGLTPLVAAADGDSDVKLNSLLLKNGFLLNFITGVLLFIGVLLFAPLLHYLNQPAEVVELAVPYLRILALSMLPLMIFQNYKQFAEGLSFTFIAMIISLLSNLLNIALNFILIFGMFGFPRMELMGAGWATFIARVVMAILMFLYVFKAKPFHQFYSGIKYLTYKWAVIKNIFRIGFPIGLQFSFEVGAFVFAAVMIGWIGTNELAAHQIAISMAALTYMCVSGISAATTVRIGYFLGAKDIKSLRMAGFSSLFMSIIFMSCCAAIFIMANDILPTLFSPNKEVQAVAASLLIVAAFFQISDGLQVVGLGILRGMKDVNIPTYTTIFAYWIFGLPMGYLFAFKFDLGAEGIWFGYVCGLSAAAILLFWRFNHISKKLLTKNSRI